MDREVIATGAVTRRILNKFGIGAKKGLGQNFLIDPHVTDKIVKAADIGKEDLVIEIGPGIGALTQPLAEAAGRVVAIEIDKSLIPVLKETLSGYDNVDLINGDVLKLDLSRIIKSYNESCDFKTVKIAANLPYYITTPIVMNFLEGELPVTSVTVMVQKEVARRMAASPGTKDYGALTLAVNYYAEAYLAANVPMNCFMPRPNVDSAVIRLNVRKTPPVNVPDKQLFFDIIKAAFSMRRKRLINCLAGNFGKTKEQITEILVNCCGFSENTRGETLSLEEFAKIATAFQNKKD